ncbi:protein FAM200C-like [Mantella aurantiaca]
MICNAKLSNSSLVPTKLKEHFLKLHGHGKYKNTTLAELKVKRARFDEKATLPVLGFVPINKPILTASYEVAYLIAKQGKLHTIGETLIKPAVLKMANIMLGKAAEVKLSQIPLSNDAISNRIEDMSKDILAQVVADLISSQAKFSLQLDETTDVSNLSQLAVFVRYVKDDVIKEEFLFCKPLTTTTKAADVKKLVDDFFKDNNIFWAYLTDIFAALNHLNKQIQGGGVNIIEAEENLKAFQIKLPLWKQRTENDNVANFPLLDDCVSKIEDVSGIGDISVPAELKQAIATHLDELAKSLDGYFPTRESYPAWVRQPFTFSVEKADVNDEYLDEIIEIQQSQVQQQLFRTTTLSTFWCRQMVTYPVIAMKALECFIPFVTTYLCEQSFSRMLDIKTKKRNRLCCENDMRVALAKIEPRISELVSERQQQKSH